MNPGDVKAERKIGRLAMCRRGLIARIVSSELVLDMVTIRRVWRGHCVHNGKPWAAMDPIFLDRAVERYVEGSSEADQ